MSHRTGSLCLVVVALLCISGCRRDSGPPAPLEKRGHVSPEKAPFPSPVMAAPSEGMVEALRAAYRLPPDGRLLLALAELDRLAGKPAKAPEVTFQEGGFVVTAGSTTSRLPQYPDFGDLLSAAAAHAKSLAFTGKAPEEPVDPPEVELASAMKQVVVAEERWARGEKPAAALAAAHQLSALAYFLHDEFAMGDHLAAQALAFLAIARAKSPKAGLRAECELAAAMGYTRHALEKSRLLPPTDSLRRHLDGSLDARGVEPGAPAETKALALREVARRRKVVPFEEAAERLFSADAPASALAAGVQMEAREYMETKGSMSSLQRAFDARLDKESGDSGDICKTEGAFGISALCAAYLGAARPLRGWSDPGRAGEGARAEQLAKIRAFGGHEGLGRARELFRTLTLPAAAMVHAYDVLSGSLSHADRAEILRLVFSRADSRPGYRSRLASLAAYGLLDARLATELHRSVLAAVTPHESGPAGAAAIYLGDFDLAERILMSPRCFDDDASTILMNWSFRPDAGERLDDAFAAYIEAQPISPSISRHAYYYFRRAGKPAKGAAIVERFRAAHEGVEAEGSHDANFEAGELYSSAGETEKGLAVIASITDCPTCGAKPAIEARILASGGRGAEAEPKAIKAARRGGPFFINQSLVTVLWRNSKWDEAARQLTEPAHPADYWDLSIVYADFVDVFRDRPVDAAAAVGGLQARHVTSGSLEPYAQALAKAGALDAAIAVLDRIQPPGAADMDVLIENYLLRLKRDGTEKALVWIRSTLPPGSRNPMCVKAYYTGQYDLLWNLIETPEKNHADWVWLIRAAAFARQGSPVGDPHRAELVQYYETFKPTSPAETTVHTLGRYLVGLAPESEIHALGGDPTTRGDIAFYSAVMAHGQGRYEAASDLYRVTIETGTRAMSGHMASRTLDKWEASRRSLPEIERDRP